MEQKFINAENTKRWKAMELRYRKAIVRDLNIEMIHDTLCDIAAECDEVRWYVDTDDGADSLINALDGDDEQAYEFKMMFADLSAECEQMQNDLDNWMYKDFKNHFNDLFVAAGAGKYGGGLLGYDTYEGDYYGLDFYSDAEQYSTKRLMRMTKKELIQHMQFCTKIFINFVGLRNRYDNLKAAMDILKDQNTGYLQIVKQIDEVYSKAEKATFGFKYHAYKEEFELDSILEKLPQETWLQ